jgi:hypothetical protein
MTDPDFRCRQCTRFVGLVDGLCAPCYIAAISDASTTAARERAQRLYGMARTLGVAENIVREARKGAQ